MSMKLLIWLNRLDREKYILLTAAWVFSFAIFSPWYKIPAQTLNAFGTDLSLVTIERIATIILALLGFGLISRGGTQKPIARIPFWIGLIISLTFPYCLKTWNPTVSFIAANYHNQVKAIIQHIEPNFAEVQSQWKQNILLDQSELIASVPDLKINDSQFFQLPSWDAVLVEGLGYSNHFFSMIGSGWILTITAFSIALFAVYISLESGKLNWFISDLKNLMPWLAIGLIVLGLPLVVSNVMDYQLDIKLIQGDYQSILTQSQWMQSWYPPLAGDTAFLRRKADASFYTAYPDSTLIPFAQGIEAYRSKDFVKAEAYFQQSLEANPNHFPARGLLAKTLLNQGVTAFNQHQPGAASDYFERVLQVFPEHVESLYNLMLAEAINGEFEKSATTAKKIIENQTYFQMPSIALLGQAYLHSAWASYQNTDVQQAWELYRKSVDKGAWKQ